MTTITIDRAVVQQGLEAMLSPGGAQACSTCQDGPENEYCCRREMWAAITALRAALAQQAEPVATFDEVWAAIDWDRWRMEPIRELVRMIHSKTSPTALAQQAEPLNLADPAVQKRLASQWGYVPAAAQAEPVQEPVAWECRAGGLKPLTQRQYDAQTVATKRHYTRIAPPQRTMVPLTDEEIDALPWNGSPRQFARAVEKASWEKNNGQA